MTDWVAVSGRIVSERTIEARTGMKEMLTGLILIVVDPKNAVAFFGKRNLWPNTASKLAVQILTYTKGYASVLSSHLFLVFGSNLAFAPKNKNQMHFSVDLKRCCKLRVANLTRNTQQVTYDSQPVFWQATAIQVHEQKMDLL